MDMGALLKKKRKQVVMSVKKLSDLSGVAERTIHRIESGDIESPNLRSLKAIAQTLNCSLDEIVWGHSEESAFPALRRIYQSAQNLDKASLEFLVEVNLRMLPALVAESGKNANDDYSQNVASE